jgi:hypothetical protein
MRSANVWDMTSGNTSSNSRLFSLNSLTPVQKPLGLRRPSNLSLRDLESARKKFARMGRENIPRAKEKPPLTDSKENTPQNRDGTPKMSSCKPRSHS